MTERRDIGSRLENWARAYKGKYHAEIKVSPTGKFCDELRRRKEGDNASPERRAIDTVDAERVEKAMCTLKEMGWAQRRARELLIRYYIDGDHPGEICREMRILHQPRSIFASAFNKAQQAISLVVESYDTFHDA